MWDYVAEELPAPARRGTFAIDMERQAITGHSMGGHGALTLAMALPGPVPVGLGLRADRATRPQSDWGRKQLAAYLGADEADMGRA